MRLHIIFIFLIFPLVLFNFKVKLYSSLNHMSVSWLVSLILHVLNLFVTSFKPSFLFRDFIFSKSAIHASCALSLYCLVSPKCILFRLITKKSRDLFFPPYIFSRYASSSDHSSLVIYHLFVQYFSITVPCNCIGVLLLFTKVVIISTSLYVSYGS